jgi:hypothetical protein
MIAEILQSFLFATAAYSLLALPAVFLIKESHISTIGKKRK